MDKAKLKQSLIIGSYCIVLYLVLTNLSGVMQALVFFRSVLRPFIYGFVIAYLINIPNKWILNKPLAKMTKKGGIISKLAKIISLLISYLSIMSIIGVLFWFIIPQFLNSLTVLVANIPYYINSLEDLIIDIANRFGLENMYGGQIGNMWTDTMERLNEIVVDLIPAAFELLGDLTSGLFNWIIGLAFSVYLLYGKDLLMHQFDRAFVAFTPRKHVPRIRELAQRTNRMFSAFIAGTLVDAIIVGVLCFIGMSALGMPFAMLVSVIIGITNIIPIIGPFIGAIPGGFIILMVDPIKALIFIPFVIALQQLDGNVIKPRVFGNKVGLPSIWVLLAIIVFGGLFGITGMFIGVPVTALLYSLLREEITNRTLKKNAAKTEASGATESSSADSSAENPDKKE